MTSISGLSAAAGLMSARCVSKPVLRSVGDLTRGVKRSPPEDERFAAISSGRHHACALRFDGIPVCWGDDRYGQASPPEGERFAVIDAGGGHTCALRFDGTPVCWGINGHGQASPPEGERFALSLGRS